MEGLVTNLLRRQHPVPLRLVVDAVPCQRDPAQRALVVLRLEPQVPLHHHDNLRVPSPRAPDPQIWRSHSANCLSGSAHTRHRVSVGVI